MTTVQNQEVLKRLLGYQMGARRTYGALGAENPHDFSRDDLRMIGDDHVRYGTRLADLNRQTAEESTPAPPVWQTAPHHMEGKLGEDPTAVRQLIAAEEEELHECEQLLGSEELDPKLKHLIEHDLIPGLQRHIDALTRYLPAT